MDIKHKLGYSKGVDAEKKSVKAYVSTFNWDRAGERFAKGAWNLDNYKKNPIVLWGHDGSKPPIGKAVQVEETPDGLFAETVFDEQSPEAMSIFSLFQRGFLNAFSVGFIPRGSDTMATEDMGNGQKGLVFKSVELLEYSAVSIPANPGALISREVAEIAIKSLGESSVKTIVGEGGERFFAAGGDEFEAALKSVIDLSRTVKGSGLDSAKLSLINTALDTLQEITTAKEAVITSDHLARLEKALDAFASVAASMSPSTASMIDRTMKKIDAAFGVRK